MADDAASDTTPPLRIGTSGWNYPAWKDGFYAGVPRRRWLAHAASRFGGVEVNATFYRAMKATTLGGWAEQVPAGFGFAVKGHRAVTHSRKLKDAADSLARQRDDLAPLGDRLAGMLWQTPASLPHEPARLQAFLDALAAVWPETAHAIEFRNPDWFTEDTAARLADAGVANAISDAGDWPRWDAVTAPHVHVRLHGAPTTYHSPYGADALDRWAEAVRGWRAEGRAVQVYFDNTEAPACDDALALIDRLGAGGGPGV